MKNLAAAVVAAAIAFLSSTYVEAYNDPYVHIGDYAEVSDWYSTRISVLVDPMYHIQHREVHPKYANEPFKYYFVWPRILSPKPAAEQEIDRARVSLAGLVLTSRPVIQYTLWGKSTMVLIFLIYIVQGSMRRLRSKRI